MNNSSDEKWQQRRFRHLNNQYGIKTDLVAEKFKANSSGDTLDGEQTVHTALELTVRPSVSRTRSLESHAESSGKPTLIESKENAVRMVCRSISSLISGDSRVRRRNTMAARRRQRGDSSGPSNCVSTGVGTVPLAKNHSFPTRARGNFMAMSGASSTNGTVSRPNFVQYGGGNGCHNLKDDNSRFNEAILFDTLQLQTPSISMNGQASSPSEDFLSFNPMVMETEMLNGTAIEGLSPEPVQNGVEQVAASEKKQPLNKIGSKLNEWITNFSDRDKQKKFKTFIKFQFSTRREPRDLKLPICGKIDPESELARQLKDESADYRPFFTYWVTTVQIIIMLFMLMQYGVGTDYGHGFGVIERSGDVMTSSLSAAHIVVWEQNNIWIGPSFADLVHAGAKYTPCMRYDAKIYEQIIRERREESEQTGCCIHPDGCFQTSECPKQFAKLVKWSESSYLDGRKSRAVCGQDPKYCRRPKSVHPFEWDADISNWPTCEKNYPVGVIPKAVQHMHCEVTGRPCCIQMHGQCRITSKEYCDFVRGYYHPNATLCSQVSCLNDVCGPIPFLSRDSPDQLFRLITPLFIHAGIIRCAISVVIQLTIMRNFEKMIGWMRLSAIYFISGIGGYLASAIFVPYMPEVGPAGSQGGVLAALIVNVIYNWHFLRRPVRALLIHLAIAAVLFATGFLPYIDNWAQLFGFIFGCPLAAALIPYITFGQRTRYRRVFIVVGSLSITALLFLVLFTIFFAYPISIDWLSLFNCPLSGRICDQQGLILRSWLPI